jgi:streptomycin 6-kinase
MSLEAALARWKLQRDGPAFQSEMHSVLPVKGPRGQAWVLKVAGPQESLRRQVAALGCLNRMARLIDYCPALDAALLQRLRPGTTWASLWSAEVDAAQTRRFARFLKGFHRDCAAEVKDPLTHARALKTTDVELSSQAWEVYAGAPRPWVVLHGDLHHYNLLLHGRATRAIDPQSWRGPVEAEVAVFLGNPFGLSRHPQARDLLQQRVRILAAALDKPEERIARWGMAHAVLGWAWSVEDQDHEMPHWATLARLWTTLS